jgi:hypothetical protein
MNPDMFELPIAPANQLKDACHTLSSLPAPTDQFAARLQFIADLMAEGAGLSGVAALVWRGPDRSVIRAVVGQELAVGRQPGPDGVTVPEDKLLSRRHFLIRAAGGGFVLQDLNSHNSTAINRPQNRIHECDLHDGDLIVAGNQVFAFLDARGKTSAW